MRLQVLILSITKIPAQGGGEKRRRRERESFRIAVIRGLSDDDACVNNSFLWHSVHVFWDAQSVYVHSFFDQPMRIQCLLVLGFFPLLYLSFECDFTFIFQGFFEVKVERLDSRNATSVLAFVLFLCDHALLLLLLCA